MYEHETWMSVAYDEIGQLEIPGAADNVRISEYLATVFGAPQPDEVAWCSAFVNWVLKQVGIEGTGSAAARSWMTWGAPCPVRYGAIAVLWRGPESWMGHVGFVVSTTATRILVLGGNQDDQVEEKWFDRSKLLATRWPA
jgi:uncharacterized protein (TIGR02594 family)